MSQQKVCLTTLAIGSKYIKHARQLALDIHHFSPSTSFVVLTDNPQKFADLDFVIPVKHEIQSVGIYHDKLDCIAECFQQSFNCCIFLDADCRLLMDITKSRNWKIGLTAKSCNDLKRYVIKNSGNKSSRLIYELAEKYKFSIEECKFISEWVFVVCREEKDDRADKFLRSWREIRDYLEANRIFAGEGAALGIASNLAGWPVHHYDTGYPDESERHQIVDAYKDRMFYKRESIPEHLRETIQELDERRREIEKKSRLSAKLTRLKNSCQRELRFVKLKVKTFVSFLFDAKNNV
jgi:hypothetical protein